ncbi:MAG: choice-of-anchor D domain-containing protein [Bacteroidota bacterium]
MNKNVRTLLLGIAGLVLPHAHSNAQITLQQDYKNYTSAPIGTFQGINFREAGFSGLYPIPNTNGKEFWVCSDRGANVDAANANPTGCTPTYDKIYGFPNYAPKIHRIRLNGDSIQILRTITMKRPNGTNATGVLNPTGFGSTATEVASTDTVLDCANFNSKIAAKDAWGIDAEGIVVDREGYFWICEEGGPTIWKLNQNGVVIKRYSPYANLVGAETIDVQIDTVFKYRKNNRGFEGITIAPNGKIYAIIQSPVLYPTKTVGENSRVHRIIEIDPTTNATRMFAYLNDGIIGASGSNQIRLRDWKIGDMAAINDTTFLVIEAAIRGTSDFRRVYKISLNGATTVHSGLYSGSTLEALVDSAGLAANSIVPVKKTLFMNLLSTGWDPALDKAEGIAILNDSTVFIGNDNDYGQLSPLENGIATATTNLSHVVRYRLQGTNKLTNFQPLGSLLAMGITGPSTGTTPYLTPAATGVNFTSIMTAGDAVGGYTMAGLMDGTGAFDNGDGTFTLLINHEMGNTVGAVHAHGSIGTFVSKWKINKTDLTVVSGQDLMTSVSLYNPATSSYITYNAAFPSSLAALGRFCSADLPAVSAFYNAATGRGTQERIFMNGEETGNEGRAFGHIVTGPNAGKSWELPYLGKFSWENSVASPKQSDTTVVMGMDDSSPLGQVYAYVGTKTNTGNEMDKAGLNNGKLFGIAVSGMIAESNASVPTPGTAFTMVDLGDVHNMTGSALNTASNTAGVTTFFRPEDGLWDPQNPNDFYFATTNSFTSPTRLWRLRFTNAATPTLGGTITAVLDGTEGPKMIDNIGIDNFGHIMMVEDVGGNAHLGKTWQYTIATDALKLVGSHDSTRFLSGSAGFLTIDEEASGIIDAESILGPGMFLVVDQAHYGLPSPMAEGGQLLAMFNPDSYNSSPEINAMGNTVSIADGDITPSTADHTNLGSAYVGSNTTKTFVIQNTGQGSLSLTGINFSGANASEFTLVTPPTFPLAIAPAASQTITVRFAPMAGGSRTATLNINSNDVTEGLYDIALAGNAIDSPEINIQGNANNIIDGDVTPGTANNTDYGNVNVGTLLTKTYVIQNVGNGMLNVSGINFTGTSAGEFTLAGSPTFPVAINTAGTYTVTVQFLPTATGARNATMNVLSNDADEATYDFAIRGTGVAAPEVNVKGNNVGIIDGDASAGTINNTDFGNVTIGTFGANPFVIQNTGAGPLTITSINFTGTEATDFTLVSPPIFPVTVAAGDSLAISVRFGPLGLGARNATIRIANNDADESIYDFALRGNGTGLAEINVMGNSISITDGDATPGTANNTHFGSTNVATTVTKNFVIQNTGVATLNVANITFSGVNASEFTLAAGSSFPLSIAPSTSQTVGVEFKPIAAGTRTASISISNNDGDEGVYDFALAGEGTVVSTVGVGTVSGASSVKLYPNPTQDAATLAIALTNERKVTINVMDIQGKEVAPATEKTLKAGQHLININTADLKNGIYFIKVEDGVTSSNVKMVIMH